MHFYRSKNEYFHSLNIELCRSFILAQECGIVNLNGYAIFVLKDGKYTQVAYSAELDITKYKEITDEDYTDKYCIGDAVVAKWDY